jgi:cytochrome b subunit of formate dehydrogenase/nitrate/TMAO reductase-like tetraheme cytochrome c subunit
MKRNVSILAVVLFGLVVAAAEVLAPAALGRQAAPPVTPSPTGRVADQVAALELGTDAEATLECQGCHVPGKPVPYLGGALFHRNAHEAFDASLHAEAIRTGKKGATCLDCHSGNGQWDTVFRSNDPRSTVHRTNVSKTCAKCHEQAATTFHDSIHGVGQARGISIAASCSDCHGSHSVFAVADPRSSVSRTALPTTCSACHQAIRSDYETSSHFAALARGDERAPTCATCHSAVSHAPAPVSTRDFNVETVAKCVECHEQQAPSYRDTFHGQATALGFKPAATCADCHTPHRNLPAADPASSVNAANLIGTCGRCHSGATASFVTYDPHAEPTNSERSLPIYLAYTFMGLLFIGVFGFFGLHTLLWLQRSIVGLVRGETHRVREGERWIVRFNRSDRATHVVMAVSFLVLAATGLPLMFYYTNWGEGIARWLGGVDVTRFLHRVFAVVTFGYAIYHLGYLLWKWLVKRERGLLWGPNSMVPRAKDLTDLYHMFRWFLYLDRRPPKFDRWTYWEKFDYFAVFWGVPIIGLSGLVLWYPNWFSNVLPGSFLNIAMIVHGEEALLATGFIFAFHFFHNHMRPENFPLDTVVFTGRLPLARFEEERPEEYERLVEEGRLEEALVPPPSRRARLLATAFGFTAYAIGLVLVVAIFWSFIAY